MRRYRTNAPTLTAETAESLPSTPSSGSSGSLPGAFVESRLEVDPFEVGKACGYCGSCARWTFDGYGYLGACSTGRYAHGLDGAYDESVFTSVHMRCGVQAGRGWKGKRP